jgi:MFS transporter, NNP family, nitrate/nitrite transporter
MEPERRSAANRVLWISTCAFTLLFNVWLMLGVLGVSLRRELGLSDSQLEWLMAAAILSGALFRLNFGIWADRFGGRKIMGWLLLGVAVPTYLFSHASTFGEMLVCAILFGLGGNAFSAGVAWNSAWFPNESKGKALGIFGAGNVGAAGTKMLVVFVPGVLTAIPAAGYLGGLAPGGWRFIPALYAALLVLMALAVFLLSPTPDLKPSHGRPLREMLRPLRHMRVWRFGLYYVVVFGAYVALSGWLPKFYIDTYKVSLSTAALLTATFIFPASLLRPLGGYLSDKLGPRIITYTVFLVMTAALVALAVPGGLSISTFTALVFVLGCAMGIGKASVFKYIPDYFPEDVGAAGGVVGALGALGGFILPPAFGMLARWTGIPQLAFGVLLALTAGSLAWLHIAVTLSKRASTPRDEEWTRPTRAAGVTRPVEASREP